MKDKCIKAIEKVIARIEADIASAEKHHYQYEADALRVKLAGAKESLVAVISISSKTQEQQVSMYSRICENCGKGYTHKHHKQKYCKASCRTTAYYLKRHEAKHKERKSKSDKAADLFFGTYQESFTNTKNKDYENENNKNKP